MNAREPFSPRTATEASGRQGCAFFVFGWQEAGGPVPEPASDAAFRFADAFGRIHRHFREGRIGTLPAVRSALIEWLHQGTVSAEGRLPCPQDIDCPWCQPLSGRAQPEGAMDRMPRTAAECAELYPHLAPHASVVVYTDWSRGHEQRTVQSTGTVVGPVRNGYVRVRCPQGTTCDYDPRDLALNEDEVPLP